MFYLLEGVSAIINIVGAIFCFYPKSMIGLSLLTTLEINRIEKELSLRDKNRSDLEEKSNILKIKATEEWERQSTIKEE